MTKAPPAKLFRLRARMQRVIDTDADSILICSLGPIADSGIQRMDFIGRACGRSRATGR